MLCQWLIGNLNHNARNKKKTCGGSDSSDVADVDIRDSSSLTSQGHVDRMICKFHKFSLLLLNIENSRHCTIVDVVYRNGHESITTTYLMRALIDNVNWIIFNATQLH